MIETRFNIKIPFFLFAATLFSFLISLFLLQLFLGLLSVLWLFESWKNKKAAIDEIAILILLFGIVRVAAIIFSVYPAESVIAFQKEILFYFGFFAMHYYLKVFAQKDYEKLVYVFAFSAVLVSLIGIIQFDFKLVDRAQSFSSGYSTFSSYLLTALGVFLILYELMNKKFSLYYWSLGVAIIFAGLTTSLGRANLFFAAVVFIIFWFIKRVNIKYVLASVILAVGISYGSFLINSSELKQRVEAPTQLADRDIIWEGANQIYKEHPMLGFGPRTFHQVFPFRERFSDKGIGSWHNDFLQIYFESGILGEISFLLLIILPFIKGISLMKKIKEVSNRSIIFGVLLSIIGLVLSALFAGFIDSPVLALVFAFLISVISREAYLFNTETRN